MSVLKFGRAANHLNTKSFAHTINDLDNSDAREKHSLEAFLVILILFDTFKSSTC